MVLGPLCPALARLDSARLRREILNRVFDCALGFGRLHAWLWLTVQSVFPMLSELCNYIAGSSIERTGLQARTRTSEVPYLLKLQETSLSSAYSIRLYVCYIGTLAAGHAESVSCPPFALQ